MMVSSSPRATGRRVSSTNLTRATCNPSHEPRVSAPVPGPRPVHAAVGVTAVVEHGHGGAQAPVSRHVTVHVSRGTCPHLAVSRRKVLFCSTEVRRSASAASIPRRARVGRLGRTRVTCRHYTRVTCHLILLVSAPVSKGARSCTRGAAWLVVASRCSLSTISQEEGGLLDSSSVISTVISTVYYLLCNYYVSTPGLWQPPHQLALLLCVVLEPAGRAAEPQPAAGTLLASLLQGTGGMIMVRVYTSTSTWARW